MTLARWNSRLIACAAVLVTPLFMGAINPQVSMDERILIAHNRERATLDLQPLDWNPELAQAAQRWADYLAASGRFEHAPENHANPEGENIWAGTKGYFGPEAMVGAWIREKQYLPPGRLSQQQHHRQGGRCRPLYPAGLARHHRSGLRRSHRHARGHSGLPLCRSGQLARRTAFLGHFIFTKTCCLSPFRPLRQAQGEGSG